MKQRLLRNQYDTTQSKSINYPELSYTLDEEQETVEVVYHEGEVGTKEKYRSLGTLRGQLRSNDSLAIEQFQLFRSIKRQVLRERQRGNYNSIKSYDSEPYNTYQTLQNEGKQKNKSSIEYFNLKSTCDYLIWEYKSQEQAPKINIIPPAPILPEKIMNSIAVQTLPIEIAPPQKKVEKEKQQKKDKQMKQKSRQKQKQKSKPFIPQLQKDIPSPSQILGIKSSIQHQDVILTESIKMIPTNKQSNKKPTSFMQYYNSVPVKKPSNILEKFIKRKK